MVVLSKIYTKTGDAGAWSARLRQGFDTLVKHAVEGFKTMPAKGGNLHGRKAIMTTPYQAICSGRYVDEQCACR